MIGCVSLLEEGRQREAEEMKERLEQQQRVRLRPFADNKAPVYSPRWFMSVHNYYTSVGGSSLQCLF